MKHLFNVIVTPLLLLLLLHPEELVSDPFSPSLGRNGVRSSERWAARRWSQDVAQPGRWVTRHPVASWGDVGEPPSLSGTC